ncbi:MAG: hypothetical protein GC131_06985 [Alphaproteobacteria bacterium]|nr:hypothetical protein [Alphaproteobacteria bacterium]
MKQMVERFSLLPLALCALFLPAMAISAKPAAAETLTTVECPQGCTEEDCQAIERARREAVMARTRAALCPQPPSPNTDSMFGIRNLLGQYYTLSDISDPNAFASAVATQAVRLGINAAKSAIRQAAGAVCGGDINLYGLQRPSLNMPDCGDLQSYMSSLAGFVIRDVQDYCLEPQMVNIP